MMKSKSVLKTSATIIFIVITIIPFIDWSKKSEIYNRFDDIEHSILQTDNTDSIFNYCNRVLRFISDNPTSVKIKLECNNYEAMDSTAVKSLRNGFIAKVHEIDNDYRNQKLIANRWMFAILISSLILAAISRTLIDKFLKSE